MLSHAHISSVDHMHEVSDHLGLLGFGILVRAFVCEPCTPHIAHHSFVGFAVPRPVAILKPQLLSRTVRFTRIAFGWIETRPETNRGGDEPCVRTAFRCLQNRAKVPQNKPKRWDGCL